jgi:hypothetical protein
MAVSKMVKSIIDDMNKTITELRCRELLRDEKGISQNCIGRNLLEITFPDKNDSGSIVFDKHVTSTEIINTLLSGQQYNILLYDKGLIQAEFIVDGNQVIKERLVFMKKHNKVWDINEINESEGADEDWFDEAYGVPIMLRVDYAPDDHIEFIHPATHLTISNHESCRIPIKGIVTFSEFVRFILYQFYDIELEIKTFRAADNTITEHEKQMIHINWK